jgi:hypothetical protein
MGLRAITRDDLPRPRFRGVSHQYAFFASLITGAVLILIAPTRKATTAAAIYAVSGCSAPARSTTASPGGAHPRAPGCGGSTTR